MEKLKLFKHLMMSLVINKYLIKNLENLELTSLLDLKAAESG